MTGGAEKPRIDPALVAPGGQIQRRPYGRVCRVDKVSEDRAKVLVRDGGTSVWVNMSTLVKKWAWGSAVDPKTGELAKQFSLSNLLVKHFGEAVAERGSLKWFAGCPVCSHEPARGSARLEVKSDMRWRCFRCGEHGGLLEAACGLWQCTPVEAAKRLLTEGRRSPVRQVLCDDSW